MDVTAHSAKSPVLCVFICIYVPHVCMHVYKFFHTIKGPSLNLCSSGETTGLQAFHGRETNQKSIKNSAFEDDV